MVLTLGIGQRLPRNMTPPTGSGSRVPRVIHREAVSLEVIDAKTPVKRLGMRVFGEI